MSGQLPVTGASTLPMILVGLAITGFGWLMTRLGRKR